MPSDLTPEQRAEALRLIRQWTAAIGSGSDDADRALDALLALGWRPEPQPAVETEDDDAHLLIAGSSIEEVQAYLYGFGNDWAQRANAIIYELSAAIDAFEGKVGPGMWRFWADKARKMAAEQKDAIAAAEARGRREGVEAAAKVAGGERRVRLALSQVPGGAAHHASGFAAAQTIFDGIRALSSIPPQEADHG